MSTSQLQVKRAEASTHRRPLEAPLAALNRRLELLPVPRAVTTVYVGSALWGIGFAIASAIRYSNFRERRFDLGNFTQAIWATAHGHFLEVTEIGGAQVSRLGIHVDPIIVAFTPLWWLWPSPLLLLTAQALALASGAIPLFWLARKHLDRERDAAFIAFSYLLCPSIGWNTLSEFHAIALAVPLLLFTVWFLDEERLLAFTACGLAAVLCQEQIGLAVCCLGLWFAFRTRRLRLGFAIAFAGLLVTAIDFAVILRHFGTGTPYSGRYAAVGGSISGIAKTTVTDPMKLIDALQPSDVLGAVLLLIPVLGLSLFSPVILAALPQAILLTLSGNQLDWRYQTQNVLLIVPFVYAAATFALAKRERRRTKRQGVRAEHVFTLSLVLGLIFGPSPLWAKSPPSAHLAAERTAVSLVPKDAPVAVTNHLGSHLAARRYVYFFPEVAKADWVVIDTADAYLPPLNWLRQRDGLSVGTHDLYWQPQLMRERVRDLQRNPGWREVFSASNVHVFKRRLLPPRPS